MTLQDLAFKPKTPLHCCEKIVLRAYEVRHGFKSIVCGPVPQAHTNIAKCTHCKASSQGHEVALCLPWQALRLQKAIIVTR